MFIYVYVCVRVCVCICVLCISYDKARKMSVICPLISAKSSLIDDRSISQKKIQNAARNFIKLIPPN